jgi:PERQ amino acid-rich with GYF domain-containing protein
LASWLTFDRPRRENRGPNGTLTLRRSSTTPHSTSSQQFGQADTSTSLSSSDASVGQSQYINQGIELNSEGRFSKNKLLDIYRTQQDTDQSNNDVTRLFMNNWDPAQSNGTNGRGWGKSNDTRDQNYGPEVCWDQSGQVQPIGLEEISELERMVRCSMS